MDKSELLKEISNTLVKVKVEKLAALGSKHTYSLSDLLDLTFYPKREVAFRAAWILESIVQTDPQRFSPHVEEFLIRYPSQTNTSCQRHFSKIMMYLTDPRSQKLLRLPDEFALEPLVEKTFEWLIDPKSPVAVQVNCLEVLFNLRQQVPWIEEELRAEIIFLLHEGGAAMQTRGKAILKKLNSRRAEP